MTMTGRDHSAMLDTKDRLAQRFQELAAHRANPRMQELAADSRTLRWQRHEILGMLAAVNNERDALGKPPVDASAIELADRQACGHVDYATKFPFYCAEIVHGVFPLIRS